MQTSNILDYRVIIRPDKRIGTGKSCYVAYCPTLGLADDGDTVEEALKNIKSTIEFHLESLVEEDKEIPRDEVEKEMIVHAQVQVSSAVANHSHQHLKFGYA